MAVRVRHVRITGAVACDPREAKTFVATGLLVTATEAGSTASHLQTSSVPLQASSLQQQIGKKRTMKTQRRARPKSCLCNRTRLARTRLVFTENHSAKCAATHRLGELTGSSDCTAFFDAAGNQSSKVSCHINLRKGTRVTLASLSLRMSKFTRRHWSEENCSIRPMLSLDLAENCCLRSMLSLDIKSGR